MKSTWSNYPWPSWVPKEVRAEIKNWWYKSFSRLPDEWIKNIGDSGNPALGTFVICALDRTIHKNLIVGRWVPTWNNTGRIITLDKKVIPAFTSNILHHEPELDFLEIEDLNDRERNKLVPLIVSKVTARINE